MTFGRRRGPSLETGTLLPWPIRFSLSSKVGGKSVMDGPDVCDEKGQGSDCGSEDARGIPRLENRETWGTRHHVSKTTRRKQHPLVYDSCSKSHASDNSSRKSGFKYRTNSFTCPNRSLSASNEM